MSTIQTDPTHKEPGEPSRPVGEDDTAARGHRVPSWVPAVGLPFGIAVLLALLVTAFAWPAVNMAPRGVDLALVAPAPAEEQIEGQLAAAAGEDAFDITALPDRAAAIASIEDREVYGAIVLGPEGGEMLVATAASPAIAQALTQMATGMSESSGTPITVTDVVALPVEDPRGLGLATGLFPLLIGGIALGAVTAFRLRGTRQKLGALTLGAVLGGLVVVGVLDGWLGALDGSYWTTSAVAALLIFAIAATITGLHRFLGYAGIGLGAVVMVVLGNPLSGITSAPEMLPTGWGAFGQWLPPGAGGSALRSVAYFDGAGSGTALLVLGCWAALGVLLLLLPRKTSQPS